MTEYKIINENHYSQKIPYKIDNMNYMLQKLDCRIQLGTRKKEYNLGIKIGINRKNDGYSLLS